MRNAFRLLTLVFAFHAFAQSDAPIRRVSLDEAIRAADKQNPTVLIAAAEVRRAEAIVVGAKSQFLPSIGATGGYTRFDAARELGGQVFSPAGITTASIGATVPIVERVSWAQWTHAKDDELVARYSGESTRRQVAISVAHMYLSVIAQRRQVEIAERARDNARQHYDYTHKRFAGGASSRLDEVRAEQELKTDESSVETSRTSLRAAQEALGVLAGEGEPLDAAENLAFDAPPDDATLEATMLASRQDVRLALERKRAARRVYDDSWNDRIPTLIFDFRQLYQSPATPAQPRNTWQAQLALSVPIYDSGFRRSAVAQRLALSEEADVQADATMRQARSDLRFALEEERRAEATVVNARAAATLAHDALNIANQSYELGATTNIEVLDAERRARDADTLAASAEDTLQQSRLDVRAAAGLFPKW